MKKTAKVLLFLKDILIEKGILMHSATLILSFDQKHTAEIIYASLAPELSKRIPRTSTNITKTKETLTLTINAQTSSSLRAAINSYGRWIETALSVQQI